MDSITNVLRLLGVTSGGALCIANDYVRDHPLSLDSMPSRIGSSAWFLSCIQRVFLLRAVTGD